MSKPPVPQMKSSLKDVFLEGRYWVVPVNQMAWRKAGYRWALVPWDGSPDPPCIVAEDSDVPYPVFKLREDAVREARRLTDGEQPEKEH